MKPPARSAQKHWRHSSLLQARAYHPQDGTAKKAQDWWMEHAGRDRSGLVPVEPERGLHKAELGLPINCVYHEVVCA